MPSHCDTTASVLHTAVYGGGALAHASGVEAKECWSVVAPNAAEMFGPRRCVPPFVPAAPPGSQRRRRSIPDYPTTTGSKKGREEEWRSATSPKIRTAIKKRSPRIAAKVADEIWKALDAQSVTLPAEST